MPQRRQGDFRESSELDNRSFNFARQGSVLIYVSLNHRLSCRQRPFELDSRSVLYVRIKVSVRCRRWMSFWRKTSVNGCTGSLERAPAPSAIRCWSERFRKISTGASDKAASAWPPGITAAAFTPFAHITFLRVIYASANWMTTFMSSGLRSKACAKSSGRSRRVNRRPSHERSARERASLALNQCRLLALTLPTITLLFSTTWAAMSAVASPDVQAPLPTPVRHMTPPEATAWSESATT